MWYRVDANYGKGWVIVGEVESMVDVRLLVQRTRNAGAKEVRVWKYERVLPAQWDNDRVA